MGSLRRFLGNVASCWRQNGDQERQDEPTLAPKTESSRIRGFGCRHGRESTGGKSRSRRFLAKGGRAEFSNNILLGGSRLQKTRLEDSKIETLKHKVETSEASWLIGFLKVLRCWKIVCSLLVDSKRTVPQPGCPRGRRILF